ncbi:MAG: hypothetical protein ABR607_12575 [Pyrinomonadaceae bacterium]
MFCPSCGAQSTIELNYCNRCGANLASPLSATTELVPINLTKPITIVSLVVLFLTLGGFAGILSSAIHVSTRVGGGDLSMAIVFFGMVAILTIDILLIRQLSKLISAALSPGWRMIKQQASPHQNELRPLHPARARLDPAPSVTENTTRFFETYETGRVPDSVTAKKTSR